MGNPVFERKRGVIKAILRAKLYGFIQVTPEEEYFFHHTTLQDVKFADLADGDMVSFIPTTGPGGRLRAVGVKRETVVGSSDGDVSSDPEKGPVPEEGS